MAENLFTDALREFIAEAVKDFRLPVKDGELCAPQVFDFDLPPKRNGSKDDFPFVIVRASSGSIEADRTEIEVYIIIGCYSENYDSTRHCLNVMSRIRNALTMLPDGTLADKYILKYPITWDLFPDPAKPQAQLDMKVKFEYSTPESKIDTGEF